MKPDFDELLAPNLDKLIRGGGRSCGKSYFWSLLNSEIPPLVINKWLVDESKDIEDIMNKWDVNKEDK